MASIAATLNPFHQSPEPQAQTTGEDDQSLATILSPQERSALTTLLRACMASMRRTITDTFDPRYAGLPSDSQFDRFSSPNPLENRDLDLGKVDVEKLDKERKDADRRIKELSEPDMQSLKSAALKYFDSWRDSVLARVGEAVNPNTEAKEQKSGAESPASSPKLQSRMLSPEPRKFDAGVMEVLRELYPPIDTDLVSLEEDKRRLVLHSVMLLLLSLEHYAAHSRILLLYLTSALHLPLDFLAEDESNVARGLLQAVEQMSAEEERKKRETASDHSRKWKVGLASVAGAAIIGLTGGLAAPLIAAGIGSVMGGLGLGATAAAGYLGTLASSTMVVGGLFGAYGGRMTGKMMDEYAKEVEDFGFVPVRKFHRPRKIDKEYRRLRVAIGISGWLEDKDDVIKPWRVLSASIEAFALKWEVETLLKLGNSLSSLLKSTAWSYAKKEIIRRTIFAALKEALWPLYLIKAARIIDNPFSVAKARADKAGIVLADALINKAQGERPVTLIGFSLGARAIYSCLLALAERKAFGLVESVVLLGAPVPAHSADWRKMRSVVAGRLVNVYSENDYILAFLYRASALQFGVAGLQKAEFVKGVENVDVSDVIDGHLRYRYLTGSILKRIGFEDLEIEEVEDEEAELKAVEELDDKERAKKESKEKKEGKLGDADAEAKDIEHEVDEKNKKSMLDWAAAKLNIGSVWGIWSGRKEDQGAEEEGTAAGWQEKGMENLGRVLGMFKGKKEEQAAEAGGEKGQAEEAQEKEKKNASS